LIEIIFKLLKELKLLKEIFIKMKVWFVFLNFLK
jgi:hypothetical protein